MRLDGQEPISNSLWVLETWKDSWWFGCNLKFCHFPYLSHHQKGIRQARELILIETLFAFWFLSIKSSLFC